MKRGKDLLSARKLALILGVALAFSRAPEVCGAPNLDLGGLHSHDKRLAALLTGIVLVHDSSLSPLMSRDILAMPQNPGMTPEQIYGIGAVESKAASLGEEGAFQAAAPLVERKAQHYLGVVERNEDAVAMGVPAGEMAQDEADESFTAMERSRVFFDGYRKAAPGSADARRGLDLVEEVLARAHALGGQKRLEKSSVHEDLSIWNGVNSRWRSMLIPTSYGQLKREIMAQEWGRLRSARSAEEFAGRIVDVYHELFLKIPMSQDWPGSLRKGWVNDVWFSDPSSDRSLPPNLRSRSELVLAQDGFHLHSGAKALYVNIESRKDREAWVWSDAQRDEVYFYAYYAPGEVSCNDWVASVVGRPGGGPPQAPAYPAKIFQEKGDGIIQDLVDLGRVTHEGGVRLKIIQNLVDWSLSPGPHAKRIHEALIALAGQSAAARHYAVQGLAKALIRSEHPKNPDLDPEIGLWIRSFIPRIIETISLQNVDWPKAGSKPELARSGTFRVEYKGLAPVVQSGLAKILSHLGFSSRGT